MKQLESTINGKKVESKICNNTIFLFCHGAMLPIYHLASLIKIKQTFLNIFEVEDNQIVLRENLFGMVCKIDELETLYKEVK